MARRKPREVKSYVHALPPRPPEEPDTREGDYYVTVRDGTRHGFLLGPFRDDHAGALAHVGEAAQYVREHYARSAWWAFGTARLPKADDNPSGKLNDVLGLWEDRERADADPGWRHSIACEGTPCTCRA